MRLFTDFSHRIFSFAPRRLPSLFRVSFILFAAQTLGQDTGLLGNSKNDINLLPNALTRNYNFKIPPRPEGHVLDSAHFLTQETLQSLENALSKEASENGVNIYLLTVPSVEKNTLDPFTKQVSETWTKGLFGATIVFDDGTGLVSIEQSDDVTKRFYDFELSRLLKDAMNTTKRPKLSRAGLEHTVLAVKAALHEFKMRADQADRKSARTRMGLIIGGVLGALLGAFEYFRRRAIPEEREQT